MSDRRFFSGDSLTQAVNQAAQHFELMPNELDYKVLEKRHGFLKVRRKVVIEVSESAPRKADAQTPEAPEAPLSSGPSEAPRAAEAATEEPAAEEPESSSESGPSFDGWSWTAVSSDDSETKETLAESTVESSIAAGAKLFDSEPADAEPADSGDGDGQGHESAGHFELAEAPQPAAKRFEAAEGEEAEAAEDALGKILALASLDLEHQILQGDEQLEVELWGPGQKILLRDRGRLLLAIQHLLPRVVRGLIGRSVSCRVDSDNFHEIREERLRDMAQRAADDVRHRGRSKTLEPMSPDERRIVHLTLSDYPGVETESQGSGLFKRVMVRKARQQGRPRGFDPYKR